MEFKVGQLCLPTKEALAERRMRTLAEDICTPQPIVRIGECPPIEGLILLAFPMTWWWKPEELIRIG